VGGVGVLVVVENELVDGPRCFVSLEKPFFGGFQESAVDDHVKINGAWRELIRTL
jgi:hypothetical protein